MDSNSINADQVTVEVLPQTVTQIIYLAESDMSIKCETENVDGVLDSEGSDIIEYEIGSVDNSILNAGDLVLDSTQMFVLLADNGDLVNCDGEPIYLGNKKEFVDKSIDKTIDEVISSEPTFLQCEACDYKTTSEGLFEKHMLNHEHERSKYLCKVCNAKFYKSEELENHIRLKHNLICPECKHVSLTTQTYVIHQNQHKKETTKFCCKKCDKYFHTNVELMQHITLHGDVLLYACNRCDKAFSSTTEVSSHLRYCNLPVESIREELTKIYTDNKRPATNPKRRRKYLKK